MLACVFGACVCAFVVYVWVAGEGAHEASARVSSRLLEIRWEPSHVQRVRTRHGRRRGMWIARSRRGVG